MKEVCWWRGGRTKWPVEEWRMTIIGIDDYYWRPQYCGQLLLLLLLMTIEVLVVFHYLLLLIVDYRWIVEIVVMAYLCCWYLVVLLIHRDLLLTLLLHDYLYWYWWWLFVILIWWWLLMVLLLIPYLPRCWFDSVTIVGWWWIIVTHLPRYYPIYTWLLIVFCWFVVVANALWYSSWLLLLLHPLLRFLCTFVGFVPVMIAWFMRPVPCCQVRWRYLLLVLLLHYVVIDPLVIDQLVLCNYCYCWPQYLTHCAPLRLLTGYWLMTPLPVIHCCVLQLWPTVLTVPHCPQWPHSTQYCCVLFGIYYYLIDIGKFDDCSVIDIVIALLIITFVIVGNFTLLLVIVDTRYLLLIALLLTIYCVNLLVRNCVLKWKKKWPSESQW